MALLASVLITNAKQRTFGAVGTQKLSTPMLLAELSHQDQMVVQMLSQTAPDLLSNSTGSLLFTDAGNSSGYALQLGMHYRDFVHVDDTDKVYTPINMLLRQHRESRPAAPAGMLSTGAAAGVFHPIDPLNKRWEEADTRNWFEPDVGHSLSYSFIATPPLLTKASDNLKSPDFTRELFITALEVRILLSNPQLSEVGKARLDVAVAALQQTTISLQWQAYKFTQPQGQPGGRGSDVSDTGWVSDQVIR